MILDSRNQAICIIQITKVSLVPFKDVPAEHAYKEGEGDKSLEEWRQLHDAFFRPYFEEADIPFTEDSLIVLEEFQRVYPETAKKER